MSQALTTQKAQTDLVVRQSALQSQTTEPGPMIWTTKDGVKMPITEMKTSHLFNAMKMTFNHLAALHGGQPVWFQHRYQDYLEKAVDDPERLAQMVILMLAEIQTRTDLPEAYEDPLRLIVAQIRGQQTLGEGAKELE